MSLEWGEGAHDGRNGMSRWGRQAGVEPWSRIVRESQSGWVGMAAGGMKGLFEDADPGHLFPLPSSIHFVLLLTPSVRCLAHQFPPFFLWCYGKEREGK